MEDREQRRVRLTTRGMAYGPYAVAHLEGKVVFVRGAAPDEEVEAVITDERPRYLYADAMAVVRPSAQRRTPPCPYLPRCGGCPWQHLDYAAQLAAKRDLVREHLRRVAKLDVAVEPVLPSPREFGYRRRIKLRVADGRIGFYAMESHTLIPIEHCLLAEASADAAIAWAGALVRAVRSPLRRVELIGCDADAAEVVVAGEVEGQWIADDEAACRAWLDAHPRVRGLVLIGRRWRRSWGDTAVLVRPEPELDLLVHAPGFTQVNPLANQLLVDTVVRLAAPGPGKQVVDLFAGAGNLSLPLWRRGAAVVAIEQDAAAAADAAAHARGAEPAFRVIGGDAARALERLVAERLRVDVAVLDPPRSGAAACIEPLLDLEPAHILYVSCDPATLARDLHAIASRYRIEVVQPIDMFPHTQHVEIVVRAALSCGSGTPGVSSARRHGSAKPRRRRRTRGRTS